MTVDSAQLCTTKIMVQNRPVLEPPFCGFVTATFLFTWHNIYNFYSRSSKGLSVYNCNCIMERLLDIQLKVWNHTRWRNNGTTHIDDIFEEHFHERKRNQKVGTYHTSSLCICHILNSASISYYVKQWLIQWTMLRFLSSPCILIAVDYICKLWNYII